MSYHIDDLNKIPEIGNNTLIAKNVTLIDSKIWFKGENNILYIEPGAVLKDVEINLRGDHSVVYISKTNHICPYLVDIYHDSVFYMGKNNSINETRATFRLSEYKNIFIGDDNMLSYNIDVRVADPHLIYSTQTMERINPSRSIYIGDHVWIGQNARILKGVKIGSGSIVAAESVLTKTVPSNTTFGGNPAKQLKNDVFWLRPNVHAFDQNDTKKYAQYQDTRYSYTADVEQQLRFEDVEQTLTDLKTPEAKFEYLHALPKSKNRFFIAEPH